MEDRQCVSPSKGLMSICAVFFVISAALIGLGSWIVHLSNALLGIMEAIVAFGTLGLLSSFLGFFGAKDLKSSYLLMYFHSTILVGASLFFFSTGAIFFQSAITTYVETRWDDLDRLRDRFDLQEDDVDRAIGFLERFFIIVGVLGYALVLCQAIAMHFTIKLLTVPMIMKNMVRDANGFMIVIGIGQMITGFESHQNSYLDAGNEWIAILFLVSGGITFVLAIVGILGAKWKDRNWLAFYLMVSVVVTVLNFCAGVGAFVFSEELGDAYTDKNIGKIACDANLYGCSNCSPPDGQACCNSIFDGVGSEIIACLPDGASGYTNLCCPEWDQQNLEDYIQTNLQFLGLLALFSFIFLACGFVGAYVLRKSLAGYQTDSI